MSRVWLQAKNETLWKRKDTLVRIKHGTSNSKSFPKYFKVVILGGKSISFNILLQQTTI